MSPQATKGCIFQWNCSQDEAPKLFVKAAQITDESRQRRNLKFSERSG
jgi:hypothetical protein